MLRCGLGWVCDDNCRSEAQRRRQESQQKRAPGRVNTEPSAAKKRFIRERDGQRCRFCGTDKGLHVHHVMYRSEGGGHAEDNLVTLCLYDHDIVHSNKRRWQPVLTELLRLHYEEGKFYTVLQVERIMASQVG